MLTRRATLGLFALSPAALALGLPTRAMAAEPTIFQRGGAAINGSDPVAYFDNNGPVAGREDLSHEWNGATWRFATEENRAAFAAAPERYAPAFGGYCAFAAARGYLAPTIPEAWSIVDNRLFLNANLRARELWVAELPDVIADGEANWPAILG